MEVRSDRTYRFDVEPRAVWDALSRVDDYRSWWPWLRRMEAEGLVVGDRWDCAVRPPVPYQLRFRVEILEAVAPERIAAEVSGDLSGEAHVSLEPAGDGCAVRLTSALSPARGPLRTVARLAPWLAHFGHDWVLDTGFRQFRRRALR